MHLHVLYAELNFHPSSCRINTLRTQKIMHRQRLWSCEGYQPPKYCTVCRRRKKTKPFNHLKELFQRDVMTTIRELQRGLVARRGHLHPLPAAPAHATVSNGGAPCAACFDWRHVRTLHFPGGHRKRQETRSRGAKREGRVRRSRCHVTVRAGVGGGVGWGRRLKGHRKSESGLEFTRVAGIGESRA